MKNFLIPALFLLFGSCSDQEQKILFLGHPYQWGGSGTRLDPRVERIPFDDYDQIWLGGDVCAKLTEKRETLAYVDSVFDFSHRRVHWTWGNHDVFYGGEDWIQQTTGRPDFYLDWKDGLLLAVLNTNLLQWPRSNPDSVFCARMRAQYDMIRQLADTVRQARQVVVLHHYGLLTAGIARGQIDPDTVFNYHKPFLKWVCEDSTRTFEQAIYPELVRIRQKGIPLTLVGGDIGMRAKKLEFTSEEGIVFLGAGINNSVGREWAPSYVTNFDPDQALVFRYDPSTGLLRWTFERLAD